MSLFGAQFDLDVDIKGGVFVKRDASIGLSVAQVQAVFVAVAAFSFFLRAVAEDSFFMVNGFLHGHPDNAGEALVPDSIGENLTLLLNEIRNSFL